MRVYSIYISILLSAIVHGCTTDDDCSGDVCLSSVCTTVSSLPEWSCASAIPETTGNFKISGDCTMTVQHVEVSNHLKLYGVGKPTITAKTSGDRRHFYVESGSTLTLNDLKLTGGSALGNGGSIYIIGGDLHATSCVFFLNTAGDGGGAVYNSGGSVQLYHSTITGNTGTKGGGVYSVYGSTVVQDSIIAENMAHYEGGGIYQRGGTLTVTRSVIKDNILKDTYGSADSGGGGVFMDRNAVVTIRESTLDQNHAETNNGHQIMAIKSSLGTPAATVVNTDFIQCSACGTGTNLNLYDADNTGNSGAAAYYSLTEKNCADGSYCTEAPYTGACTDVAQGMTCADATVHILADGVANNGGGMYNKWSDLLAPATTFADDDATGLAVAAALAESGNVIQIEAHSGGTCQLSGTYTGVVLQNGLFNVNNLVGFNFYTAYNGLDLTGDKCKVVIGVAPTTTTTTLAPTTTTTTTLAPTTTTTTLADATVHILADGVANNGGGMYNKWSDLLAPATTFADDDATGLAVAAALAESGNVVQIEAHSGGTCQLSGTYTGVVLQNGLFNVNNLVGFNFYTAYNALDLTSDKCKVVIGVATNNYYNNVRTNDNYHNNVRTNDNYHNYNNVSTHNNQYISTRRGNQLVIDWSIEWWRCSFDWRSNSTILFL